MRIESKVKQPSDYAYVAMKKTGSQPVMDFTVTPAVDTGKTAVADARATFVRL